MDYLKFYLVKQDNTEIELYNINYPSQYTDVMDGSFDSGSFECILDLDKFNLYKEKELREGEFIRREILKENNIIDNTLFIIEEVNGEKDSLYNENKIKVTIKYTESTSYLTNLVLSNHTYSITPIIRLNKESSEIKNSLYDVLQKSYNMLGERNNIFNIETNSYRKFNISNELNEILKKYPNKNRTYTDANFYDVCKENLNDISSVPYYDALNRKLTYISSMGKNTNKEIKYDNNKFVVSNSWNRNKSNNTDVIENKAVNIYEDYESMWYPNNIPLDDNDNFYIVNAERLRASNYVRPKGLNEGLEEYQNWYNWYLELPFNIERIEKLYYLNVSGYIDEDGVLKTTSSHKDVTNRIVEESVYKSLTETEKKKFAYYKKGSNRINAVAVASGLTTEDDKWPWDRIEDNNVAFRGMFAVKYKPIIDTDITLVKNGNKTYNKRNIAIASKNISDADLVSQSLYELEKNYYSQYMLEIAGEYQNIFAGELVDIKGFENYGINTKKYLIYKVDTTFEKGGCHQIIYFNEMIAKNSVLLNENNLVRISQNPSYESLINRIFKKTDCIGIKSELVQGKIYENYEIKDTYCGKQFAINSFFNIIMPYIETYKNNNIKGIMFKTKCMKLNALTLKEEEGFNEISLLGAPCYLNSGTVSQVIVKAIDNCIWDNKYEANGVYVGNPGGDNLKLKSSLPVRYTDYLGQFESVEITLLNTNMKENNESKYDELFYNYYPVNINENLYENNKLFNLQFGKKDIREIMQIVYEQSWYGVNDKVKLTDYFTSCTSSFSGELPLIDTTTTTGGKFNKMLSIFDKKIYNINSIDESPTKVISYEKYYDIVSFDGNSIYIKLSDKNGNPFKGKVGDEIGEYSIAIYGVSNFKLNPISYDDNNDIVTSGGFKYASQIYVPQIVITVPKHVVKEEEYVKLTIETNKL